MVAVDFPSKKYPDGMFGSANGPLGALASLLFMLAAEELPTGVRFRQMMFPVFVGDDLKWVEQPLGRPSVAPRSAATSHGKFDAMEKAECAERELKMRNRVYGRGGDITLQHKREIDLMAEIAADYRALAGHEQNDMFGG
jgi:hypothetical protein